MDGDLNYEDDPSRNQRYFLNEPDFKIKGKSEKEIVIIAIYFAFTTLSTVGFGDFYPCSDFERFIGGWVLFIGDIMFSYIMGYFIEKLESFKALHEDENEDEELQKFLLAIRHFNDKKRINNKFKRQIDKYFKYRWKNDRNIPFRSEQDLLTFKQMPEFV